VVEIDLAAKVDTHMTGTGKEQDRVQILVAEVSPKTEKSTASLSRNRWWFLPRFTQNISKLTLTYYYPYYFQSWKATIPKSMGRTMRVRLVTGVNGMSRSVGPATEWPVGKEVTVGAEEVILPRTSEAEAEQLSQEYIGEFVTRRYRPSKPPTIERERVETFYVPYYVYAREGQPLHKAALIEGFTGARGRVKDVPAIREALATGEMFKGPSKGG
jgi:hypothetical protein